MKKVEYYCCWLDIYNAQAIQDFLDEKGKLGWLVSQVIPGNDKNSHSSFFIMVRELVEQ